MEKNNRSAHRTRAMAAIGTLLFFASFALADEVVHPVLKRYPSRDALQQRIEEVKASNEDDYQGAQRDFDEAIWRRYVVTGPKWPGPPIPRSIKPPEPRLSAIWTRREWKSYIKDIEEMEGGGELAQFYRDHLGAFSIDDSVPALKEVLIDVLLNGWHDWDNWNSEKLVALRDKFPELHRVYAIRELRRLMHKDAGGVLLKQLVNSETPPYLHGALWEGVKDIVVQRDALAYLLDIYLEASAPVVRTRLERTIPGISGRAGKSDEVKEIWRPYLESEIPFLRFEARKTFGLSVPDLFTCNDIHERWVAENDPDPGRREKARKNVKNRETVEQIRQLQRQNP